MYCLWKIYKKYANWSHEAISFFVAKCVSNNDCILGYCLSFTSPVPEVSAIFQDLVDHSRPWLPGMLPSLIVIYNPLLLKKLWPALCGVSMVTVYFPCTSPDFLLFLSLIFNLLICRWILHDNSDTGHLRYRLELLLS